MLVDHRPDVRTLVLTGEGCEALLHGQATSEVRQLASDRAVPTAFCNPKGRMISQGILHRQDDAWLLTVDASLFDITLAHLKKYGVFYKVSFGEYEGHHRYIYQSEQLASGEQWQVVVLPNKGHAIQLDQAGELWCQFDHGEAQAEQPSTDLTGAWYQAGLMLITESESQTLLPQALGLEQMHGVSFKKGCFTGQEIVARVHYKGKVKHRLTRFQTTEDCALGADIEDVDGNKLGTVVRCAPLQGRYWVLGLVSETQANELTCAGAQLSKCSSLLN